MDSAPMVCVDGITTDPRGSFVGDEASVPTPLRRRSRGLSPTTPVRQRPSLGAGSAKALGTPGSAERISDEEEKEAHVHGTLARAGFVVPWRFVVTVCLGSLMALAAVKRYSSGSPGLHMQHVIDALACPGTRADILDVLGGAPYEFEQGTMQTEGSMNLSMVVRRAIEATEVVATPAHAGHADDVSDAEADLRQVALLLSTTGGNWPPALKRRMRTIVGAPCNEGKAPCTQTLVHLEVDPAYTSPPATSTGSNWLHHALLKAGAATGLPRFRERAEQYSSRRPSIVTLPEAATVGDCFALRGNASIALRVGKDAGETKAALVRRVVIEQPPRWAMRRPHTAPRHFSVYAEPAQGGQYDGATPYTELLGSFEYALAAPATQAFELAKAMPVSGLRFVFHGPGWGAEFMCVYRLRAFEAGPECGA